MSNKDLIMVFDTETTGLLNKNNQPHIIQLCYIIYDIGKKEVVKTFNQYIKIDDSIHIPIDVMYLTGITRYVCDNSGFQIEDALMEFCMDYQKCSTFVAHRIIFDTKMIAIELMRNKVKLQERGLDSNMINDITEFKSKHLYCTMKNSKLVCGLVDRLGRPKPPKLSELYFHFFKTEPDGLHDALVDTTVCLKCYLKLIDLPKPTYFKCK